MSNRSANSEIFRVLMILGICMLHAIESSGHDIDCIKNPLRICVNGFVFISGWYGINLKWSKVFRLFSVSIIAAVTSLCFLCWTGGAELSFSSKFLKDFLYLAIGQWYLLSYCVLMLFAPLLNYLVEHAELNELRKVWVPMMLIVLWNWLSTAPVLSLYLKFPSGFGAFTPLSLMVAYVIARFFKKWSIDSRLSNHMLIAGLLIGTICMTFGWKLRLWGYNTPTATIYAGLIFIAFQRFPKSAILGRVATIISPSVFSIYLLHSNHIAFAQIEKVGLFFINTCQYPYWLTYVILWAMIFTICLVLDVPRRLMGYLLRPVLNRAYDAVDLHVPMEFSR